MQLCWWKTKQDAEADRGSGRGPLCKGFINLPIAPVEIKPVLGNETTFMLQPCSGTWAPGAIAKGDTGRAFTLDSTDSEHARDAWVSSISEHIKRARQVSSKDTVVADSSFYSALGLSAPSGR
eukprot:UN3747